MLRRHEIEGDAVLEEHTIEIHIHHYSLFRHYFRLHRSTPGDTQSEHNLRC